jgi:hypothetical protein
VELTREGFGGSEGAYPPEHAIDGVRIERAVRKILLAIGEDPTGKD